MVNRSLPVDPNEGLARQALELFGYRTPIRREAGMALIYDEEPGPR